MIAYIRGKLTKSTPSYVILEVNGVGYLINIPASAYSSLPPKEKELQLHTTLVTRDMDQSLYGFISSEERDLFESLTTVNGIGPKIALSLIGHLPLKELQRAIATNDVKSISKVPGIGKKTSERLIIEMRDKIPSLPDNVDLAFKNVPDILSRKINDAMSALINLGYNQNTAQKAIKKSLKDLPESIDLPSLITHSLKWV